MASETEPGLMAHDHRTVEAVHLPDGTAFFLGGAITRLEIYGEAGQMGYVPALAIWNGDRIASRTILAPGTSITYADREG